MVCDKNSQKITQMFDEISGYYDKMNNFISLGTHNLIKKTAIKDLKIHKHANVLDLCCGTGDFTGIINKLQPNTKIIGLDNSVKMLKLAKLKNPEGVFIQADCTSLPFKENEFDYISIGFGLRNIENRGKALSEIYRTLKKGGKFLHLDFGMHNLSSKIFDFIVRLICKLCLSVGRRGDADKNYEYLIQSKNEYPEPNELIKEFELHGFKLIKRRDFLFGVISYQILNK